MANARALELAVRRRGMGPGRSGCDERVGQARAIVTGQAALDPQLKESAKVIGIEVGLQPPDQRDQARGVGRRDAIAGHERRVDHEFDQCPHTFAGQRRPHARQRLGQRLGGCASIAPGRIEQAGGKRNRASLKLTKRARRWFRNHNGMRVKTKTTTGERSGVVVKQKRRARG